MPFPFTMKSIRLLLFATTLALFLTGCLGLTAAAPLATDDCGPKPRAPGRIIAAWLNARTISLSHGPFTAGELSMSEPRKVAVPGLTGRIVGWEVILGPENRRVVDYTEVAYARAIINRDRVISFNASSFPFR